MKTPRRNSEALAWFKAVAAGKREPPGEWRQDRGKTDDALGVLVGLIDLVFVRPSEYGPDDPRDNPRNDDGEVITSEKNNRMIARSLCAELAAKPSAAEAAFTALSLGYILRGLSPEVWKPFVQTGHRVRSGSALGRRLWTRPGDAAGLSADVAARMKQNPALSFTRACEIVAEREPSVISAKTVARRIKEFRAGSD